jgi:quercetin dioxygenase-like cupin family protein
MKKVSLSDAPKVPFDLDGYIIHTSSTLEVIHLCLQPGQTVPQHANPFEVVACLIEGEVIAHIGVDQIKLGLHDVLEVEKNADRGFTNSGTLAARLIIMKKL